MSAQLWAFGPGGSKYYCFGAIYIAVSCTACRMYVHMHTLKLLPPHVSSFALGDLSVFAERPAAQICNLHHTSDNASDPLGTRSFLQLRALGGMARPGNLFKFCSGIGFWILPGIQCSTFVGMHVASCCSRPLP